MPTKWLLIDTPTWAEGKALVHGFFSAYPDLDASNVDYLEYESGTAVVDGKQIAINRSSNEPMKTSQGFAVKVDMHQVRKVGGRVDEYLAAHPEVPVRYVSMAEMRDIVRQEDV